MSLDRSPIFRPVARASSEVRVRVPKPPIWQAHRIMTCPNIDHCSAVETVVRPVTVTALVAVKNA